MSFGRPPSINVGFKPAPPDRGSFPLDHFGECKDKMKLYMDCLRQNSSTSTPCRALSKDYLECRMQKYGMSTFCDSWFTLLFRGLMERDDWKNLGLANVQQGREEKRS
ncbi:hypothetical protein AMATHDRAFT_3906 [Amanita thiersii Skay4041]|uniref:Cytochrome c oxidase assembly protein COX19 n=1 Tax=Amanita thiersii Skay4041 TaxID=703135 RepID=A0A2A9NQC7_9AGAR|nr:hypothetical protein AMATHDRAFT_3906 [Amanita thiersii Skay4041]